jgi:hypothetical protein
MDTEIIKINLIWESNLVTQISKYDITKELNLCIANRIYFNYDLIVKPRILVQNHHNLFPIY